MACQPKRKRSRAPAGNLTSSTGAHLPLPATAHGLWARIGCPGCRRPGAQEGGMPDPRHANTRARGRSGGSEIWRWVMWPATTTTPKCESVVIIKEHPRASAGAALPNPAGRIWVSAFPLPELLHRRGFYLYARTFPPAVPQESPFRFPTARSRPLCP